MRHRLEAAAALHGLALTPPALDLSGFRPPRAPLPRHAAHFEHRTGQEAGRLQLQDNGIRPQDLVFAVTEGGETSAVIGTALALSGCALRIVPLRDAAPAKAAQAKLETEFGRREKELNDAAARLKAAADKFEKDQVTLAEAERARRQRDLVEQERDLQRKRREFQEDLGARKNEELGQVLERANKVVKQLAEAEKYDVILQEAVYINPKHDITDKVIKAMNAAGNSGK